MLIGVSLGATAVQAQSTQLPGIVVQSQPGPGASAPSQSGGEAPSNSQSDGEATAYSPVQGYVATRSATGSKTDTPLSETPRSITVVGQEQITDQGARTVQEAIRYVPGVLADGFGLDSRGDYFLIRGIPAAIFLDGLRTSYGYYYNETALDPYTLERVEVLRGPASMLYGQTTTGGIVNAISKRPQEKAHREIGVEYGSFDFKQVKFDMTGPVTTDGKWLYRVVGVVRDSETQVDYVDNDRLLFAPSLTYRPSKDTSIALMGRFQKDHTGSAQQFLPLAGTLYPNVNGQKVPIDRFVGEPSDKYDTEGISGTLIIDHKINDRLKFHHAMRYAHTENDYKSHYAAVMKPEYISLINTALGVNYYNPLGAPFLEPNGTTPTQSNIARAFTDRYTETDVFTSDTRLTGTFVTGRVAHKVTGGIDFTHYVADGKRSPLLLSNVIPGLQSPFDIYNPQYGLGEPYLNFDTGAPAASYDRTPFSQTQIQQGLYIQDELRFGNWIAVAGVRRDYLTIKGLGVPTEDETATSRRAGLMYKFDFGLSPYVSYSESFTPQAGQFVVDFLGSTVRRPARPVTGEQIEAGFKYQVPGMPFIVNAAIYELKEKNRLVSPFLIYDSLQGADARFRGFEIQAAGNLTANLKAIAAYSYTEGEYTKYPTEYDYNVGTPVEGVPEHTASLWLMYSFKHGWDGWIRGLSVGGGVRYVGESHDVGQRTVPTTELFEVTTPSYTLFDATIAYETDTWRWQLTAQNIADKYHVVQCTADRGDCGLGQGRTIITGLTYKF